MASYEGRRGHKMAADVMFSDFKHPYIIALVRWCVSSFWSSATVLLHRLGTAPRPITAPKPPKSRPASYDHLHPEPLVDCSVLHAPEHPDVDVIFVHGLYGSLANTWRQGEWRSRYGKDITKVPLRRPHALSTCECTDGRATCTASSNANETGLNETDVNEGDSKSETNERGLLYENINEGIKNITNDDIFITEKFYANHQVEMMNYDTQAQFVRDLFECSNGVKPSDCECDAKCEVGCGCVCDGCYSPCWPRDWVKVDYPGARVISINYTSDPHLWRPLWVKPSQRLRLHERAEQMMSQLLALGVGQRPIIWVGHSKGGLFIKQIYCDAYEAYMKNKGTVKTETNEQNTSECNNDNRINHRIDKHTDNTETDCDIYINGYDSFNDNNNLNETRINEGNALNVDNMHNESDVNGNMEIEKNEEDTSEASGVPGVPGVSSLYVNSAGFMFYSVPHRGSPLADIKAPLTARSVELTEICKVSAPSPVGVDPPDDASRCSADCPLVVSLQAGWRAAAAGRAAVRSVVETGRTRMSVLHLRIVSVDSADPGIGSLHGVSVDHREICKPASRRCLLYQELMTLMGTALRKRR